MIKRRTILLIVVLVQALILLIPNVNFVTGQDTNEPPVADFSATPRNGIEPLIVFFSDESNSSDGIVSWSWDFGDGTTSDEQNPEHSYRVGQYTVSLTVEEADEDTDTSVKEDYITVTVHSNLSPVADSAGPYSGVEGEGISFDGSGSSDSDGTIVSWFWDFGDDETSTSQNPMHVYAQDGTYQVTLTVTDDDSAEDSDTTQAVIADTEPLASFSASPTSGWDPLIVKFTGRRQEGQCPVLPAFLNLPRGSGISGEGKDACLPRSAGKAGSPPPQDERAGHP